MNKRFFHHNATRYHKGNIGFFTGVFCVVLFLQSCNSNEKVELTKDEKAEAHNTVLNRTPKLLDSLDKECAQNFVSNRQHFIDSLLKVRLEKIQLKVSTNPIQ